MRLLFLLPAVLFFITLAPVLSICQEAPLQPGADAAENEIHITADRLVSNSETQLATFSGNVRATQGTSVIVSDKLDIYYKKGIMDDAIDAGGEESIEKIVATGNVVINFDDKVAVTDEAVYTTEKGIIILTGPNSKVTSQKNSVAGEKIVLYRNEDRIIVERGAQKRVEAVFFSKSKGLE
jgi:lipopolysaccharide export system protein LptA